MSDNGEEDVIDIAIADKSPIVQSGLRALFENDGRFSVVAVAADGERFMEAVERLSFDVAVTGWEMPYLSGAGVLRALRGQPDAPRIVIYTGSQDLDVPRQAMALGAAGFCHKSDPPERLIETVVTISTCRARRWRWAPPASATRATRRNGWSRRWSPSPAAAWPFPMSMCESWTSTRWRA
jgi:two-component system nitrate/nitrite response regulator NarP